MITLYYQMDDLWETYRDFGDITSAQKWLNGLEEGLFRFVTMEDESGVIADGYMEIVNYGR